MAFTRSKNLAKRVLTALYKMTAAKSADAADKLPSYAYSRLPTVEDSPRQSEDASPLPAELIMKAGLGMILQELMANGAIERLDMDEYDETRRVARMGL